MEINLNGLFDILPWSLNKWKYRNIKANYEVESQCFRKALDRKSTTSELQSR